MRFLRIYFKVLAALWLFASASLIAQTTYRTIPMDCGGWFSGFAIHSSGRLYGFGDVFGMWRSDDAGQSWQFLQGDFTTFDIFINGCAVATANADRVAFVNGGSPTNSRVYTSIDGGSTWANRLSDIIPRRDRGATPIIFHPANDDEIWLASKRTGLTGSLWRSLDGGATWSKMGGTAFDSVVATTIYVRPEFPDQIWVGAAGGLYVSSNRGTSFTQVWSNAGGVTPYGSPTPPPTVYSIARRADGVGYIATNSKGWRITATDYNNPATYTAAATVSWWSGWGPNNATVLADGTFLTDSANNNTARSLDGGQTWSDLGMQLVTPPTPAWVNAADASSTADAAREMIVQDPTNSSRWFMTGGLSPVITTDSGATWKYPPIGGGIAGVKTYKTRFPRSAPDMALVPGSDHGVFTVTDGGLGGGVLSSSRSSITEQQTYHDVMASDDGQTLVAAGTNQGANTTIITRSTNAGATWSKLGLTSSGLPASYEGVTRAVMAPGNPNDFLVLLGYNSGAANNNPGLYRTTNGGATFTKATGIADGVNTGMRYHHELAWLETDGINANTRYLVLRADNNSAARGFYRSTDGGSTWAMTSVQPYGTASYIDCMAVDRATAGRVWVCNGSSGVRRSDDGGSSWSTVGAFSNITRLDAAYGRVAVWGRLSGDTWNKIYYSADNGATWAEKTGSGHRYAYLSDLAVDPNRAGQIWVSGNSIDLINPPVTPTAPPPAAPTGFAAALSGLQANLSWTDNATDETGYGVEVRIGSSTTWTVLGTTAPNATTYTRSGLLDGVTYAYRIRSVRSSDNTASAYSAIISLTPPLSTLPLAPAALTTSSLSTSQILISWAENAYNESGYQVERSTVAGSGFALLTTTAAGATTFTDTGLGEGVLFYYRVRAVNALGSSAPTAVVVGTTLITPPANLLVTGTSDTAISLSWSDNTTAETSYVIERSATTGTGFGEIATAAANATTFADTTVTTGATYYYRVRARNAVAHSEATNEASALASNYQAPAFYEPFNYSLTSPTSIVGRPGSGSGGSGNWTTDVSVTPDTLTAGSLVAGRITGTGNQLSLANYYSPTQYTYANLYLNLDANVQAITTPPANGTRTFWVSFLARSPNTLPSRLAQISFRVPGGSTALTLTAFNGNQARTQIITAGSNTISSSNNAIAANTTYFYLAKVTFTDTDGNAANGTERIEARFWQYPASSPPPLVEPTTGGIYRSPLTVTSRLVSQIQLTASGQSADSIFAFDEFRIGSTYAQVALPPPPSPPTNLTFSAVSATAVTLNWTDAAADETGYRVQRSTSATGPFTDIATLAANATTYTDTGLTAGTVYYYRVIASNGSGESGAASANVTPQAPPAPVVTPGQTASGAVTVAFSYSLLASNSPTSYALTGGSLPPGVTLNSSTGVLSGTPTSEGNYTATLTATNETGVSPAVAVNFTIEATPVALAYEPFAYSAGTGALANQNGGTGWSSAWTAGTNDINATGLTLTSGIKTLVASGGRAVTQSNQNSFRVLPAAYTSGTYWLSFLAKSSNPGNSYGGLSLFSGSGTERVFFGQPNATTNWGIAGGTVTANNTGTPALLVVRVVLNSAGNDTATLWVNPALGTVPSDASAASTFTAEMGFDRVRLASGSSFDFDEIRFGPNFDAVTPYTVPLPAITAGQTPAGTVNTAFTYPLLSNTAVSTYTLASGSLPPGVSLNPTTGVLSGTPTQAGISTATFTASNEAGTSPAVVVSFLIAAAPTALAYEPFAYTAGTGALASQNGGTGWASTWTAANNDINATGFTYTSGANTLATSGGRASTYGNQNSFRTLPSAYTSGTYWFSFLAKSGSPGSDYGGLSLFSGTSTERVFFGQPNNTSNWGIASGTVTTNSTGTQAFLVVRVVLNSTGNDTATLWVNPSLAATPSDANAASTYTAEMGFDRLRLASGTSFDFDEIRFGTSYASVAPLVPKEPGAPTGLAVTANATGQLTLSWIDNASNEVGFKIERSLDGSTSWTQITGTTADTTSFTDTALAASTVYFYRVRAANTAGDSAYTSIVSGTTFNGVQSFRTVYGIAPNGSQDTAAPAGDGVANLLKYAFNLLGSGPGQATSLATPNASVLTASGSAGLPLVGVDGSGRLTLTYIRRKTSSAPGITYVVQFSNELGLTDPWAVNLSATESTTSLDATFERVTTTDSLVAPARRFARVRVFTP